MKSTKLKRFFSSRSNLKSDDEALDASLMRQDRKKSKRKLLDNLQNETLESVYEYHRVNVNKIRKKCKKQHQFDAFIRKNSFVIDNARTANLVILGNSGVGKTKLWWNFLNYFKKNYDEHNSWGLTPKDFYHIITEKIMNISIDMLLEYKHHRQRIENKEYSKEPPSTCLSANDLMDEREYKLEVDTDNDVKDGLEFFEDLLGKLSKIQEAISHNVQIEEKKKLDGIKPKWGKIQELRHIEKEIKEFSPNIASKIANLWKSQQLRDMFLFKFGLSNSRNLFYFIDNVDRFGDMITSPEQGPMSDNEGQDDEHRHRKHKRKKKRKWEWIWSFEETLRCQIRTTGVIESSTSLSPVSIENQDRKEFHLRLKLWDVGGAQNERKKWKHVLNTNNSTPDMDCVIFVVNLMSYYKKSWESDKNGLLQSLQLFTCLLSQFDQEHMDKYHTMDDDDDDNKKMDLKDLINDEMPSPQLYMSSSMSQEELICVDSIVKRAISKISLFYIIFTDTEGMKEMLQSGVSFKQCCPDYDGDNSITDVQTFIENKFRNVIHDANGINSTKLRNKRSSIISNGSAPYVMRSGSTPVLNPMKEPSNIRAKTIPDSMKMKLNEEKNDKDSDNESVELSDIDGKIGIEQDIQGTKRLKCRFVSVIDYDEMKTVMNEIVKTTFMDKSSFDTVVQSLLLDM